MTDILKALTSTDVQILKRVVNDFLRRNKQREGNIEEIEDVTTAPEVYLFKPVKDVNHDSRDVQHGGRDTTHGPDIKPYSDGEPGASECEVYQPTGLTGTGEPLKMDFKQHVLNFSKRPRTSSEFIPGIREKYGKYLALGGDEMPIGSMIMYNGNLEEGQVPD